MLRYDNPRAVGNNFNDKETLTADPLEASHVYAVWMDARFNDGATDDILLARRGGRRRRPQRHQVLGCLGGRQRLGSHQPHRRLRPVGAVAGTAQPAGYG